MNRSPCRPISGGSLPIVFAAAACTSVSLSSGYVPSGQPSGRNRCEVSARPVTVTPNISMSSRSKNMAFGCRAWTLGTAPPARGTVTRSVAMASPSQTWYRASI